MLVLRHLEIDFRPTRVRCCPPWMIETENCAAPDRRASKPSPTRAAIVRAMRGRIQPICVLLALALLTAGCAGVTLDAVRADVAAGHGHLITTVPFIAQEEYQCGPASLAMVL